MLEIIQWTLLVLLGGMVGWLWKSRSVKESPDWVSGIDEDDLVMQNDLDQYHHRVVQLSHAQRDLLLKKIATLETRLKKVQSPPMVRGPLPSQEPIIEKPLDPPGKELDLGGMDQGPETPAMQPLVKTVSEVTKTLAADLTVPLEKEIEVYSDASHTVDPTERILQLWRDGQTAEQIARELRMGRQEVQLLIEMSRHAPLGATKG